MEKAHGGTIAWIKSPHLPFDRNYRMFWGAAEVWRTLDALAARPGGRLLALARRLAGGALARQGGEGLLHACRSGGGLSADLPGRPAGTGAGGPAVRLLLALSQPPQQQLRRRHRHQSGAEGALLRFRPGKYPGRAVRRGAQQILARLLRCHGAARDAGDLRPGRGCLAADRGGAPSSRKAAAHHHPGGHAGAEARARSGFTSPATASCAPRWSAGR